MAKIYTDLTSLRGDLQAHPNRLSDEIIDSLVYSANLSDNDDIKSASHKAILTYAPRHGVRSASIHDLYMGFASGEVSGFSVPGLNIRTLTYDLTQRIFSLMQDNDIGPVLFEIAVSEQEYTGQQPSEYASSVLGGAMRAGYQGPVFLLGDHYQLRPKNFHDDKSGEIKRLEHLIQDTLRAGFKNIDIDGSTLVNLEPSDRMIQQKDNYEITSHLAKYIRTLQPADDIVAIGAEIGHIGGVNSTTEDLEAFLNGFERIFTEKHGIAKIAIQTGTSHGGTPQADGSLADVNLDAHLHTSIGAVARHHGIGGTVQHGASTLPQETFKIFPEKGALEVHLATRWQNIMYESMSLDRRDEMYAWIHSELSDQRKDNWSDEQFIYKLRKKAFGRFKKEMWEMSLSEKKDVLDAVMTDMSAIFEQLNILHTKQTVQKFIP